MTDDDRTTRDDVVEQLRSHADSLDERGMTPGDAADETRRLARTIEREGPEIRTDGSGGALAGARKFGAAGINLTEQAMGNLFLFFVMLQWVAAGAEGFSASALLLLAGGAVCLAIGNRLKGWSE